MLARMVRTKKPGFAFRMEQVVAEVKLRKLRDTAVDIEGEASEDDNSLEVFEEVEFAFEKGLAVADFGGVRFIVGRGAAD